MIRFANQDRMRFSQISLLITAFTTLIFIKPTFAEPTASELLSLTESCTPLTGVNKFKTDEASSTPSIPMCQINGAIWFKADMDIDCDGGQDQACLNDETYLPETSCVTSTGQPLNASRLPFVVLPQNSSANNWKDTNYGLKCGSLVAVIYNNKLEYGVFGDRGPKNIIGEASYAMAKRLGINPDPNTGGTASGVTYIVFTGANAVSRPVENHAKAVELGKQLATQLIANNGTAGNQRAVNFTKPTAGQSFSVNTPVTFEGTAESNVVEVRLLADGRWKLGTVPVIQNSWSIPYRFSGAGNRTITALGIDTSGSQVATATMTVRIAPAPQAANEIISNIKEIVIDQWEFFDRGSRKENQEGFWQRVVVYWQEGVNRNDIDTVAEVSSNNNPWSAAFISYVMRKAGAGNKFLYSSAHARYIKDAIKNKRDGNTNAAFIGHRITEYSPRVGDLVCAPRSWATESVTYNNALSFNHFPSHCDIVVTVGSNAIDVIGGNVNNSVSKVTLNTVNEKVVQNSQRKWITVIQNNLRNN